MTPATALDAAHLAMQTGGEAEALRFYRLLADAPLCLLLAGEPTAEALAPQVFELSDGPVILAFDSEERLATFQAGPMAYASLPGRIIAGQMAGQGLWLGLNLGTGAASETLLPPEALDHLLTLLDVVPQQTEARAEGFCAPAAPAALEDALRIALAGFGGLAAAAVLVGVVYKGRGRSHVLALVGTVPEAQPALARAMAEALSFAGLEAATLDVTFLDPDNPALGQMLRVGTVFEVPQPKTAQSKPIPPAPGSDPARPPRLR